VQRAASAATGQNWTVYHHDRGGSGTIRATVDLSPASQAWESVALDGSLYGEPLVLGNRVYVATENDTVYSLSAATGAVVWKHHLATPVLATDLPCGDISPTVGITSTPVIDEARQEIFVVADEEVGGTPEHKLYGLSLAGGRILLRKDVDPPGAETAAILQRVSLTLDRGQVVFGYGGNAGDCPVYHGWVVAVPETGGAITTFEVDSRRGESQGAVWMGGAAPAIDPHGNVWVATGNGSVTSASGPYDHSDSVLELSPTLHLEQHFAPSTWYADNSKDLDLGSEVPAVLPNGLVVQAGKSQTLYLLNEARLGGIGHELQSISGFCGGVVDGGVAFSGNVVYLPCVKGIEAVQTDPSTRTVKVLWQTSTRSGGPPIVAGGLVWTISGSSLYGLSPSTGAMEQQLPIVANATHFPTPSVGDGLLLAPADNQVIAFRGPTST
jgi:outer membrane protein assembly factor BamB